MALSKNTPVKEVLGDFTDLPLYQAIHAYEGSMLFLRADGYVTTAAGGLMFLGHADAEADNSSGLDGALNVRIRRGIYRLQVTLTGVAITDQGKDVYASDDATLTLTVTSNSRVGKVVRYVASNTCIVEFEGGVGGDVVNHEHTAGTDGGPLTSPRVITAINDTNGNELIKVTATGSAVNEITLANAATGAGPTITASGETNVPVTLAAKGTGKVALGQATSIGVQMVADQAILDSSENELVKFTKASTAVNEITVANAATGNAPSIKATGETNVGLTVAPKGTGVLTLCDAITEKLAFFGAAGAVQQAHIANASGDDATAVNAILAVLETFGLVASS